MRRLTNYGIYRLPGVGRELVALRDRGGGFLLYDDEYDMRLPPRFEVRADGRIVNWHGEVTKWMAEDLIDTGRTGRIAARPSP